MVLDGLVLFTLISRSWNFYDIKLIILSYFINMEILNNSDHKLGAHGSSKNQIYKLK